MGKEEEVFDCLFNEINTYEMLPQMVDKAISDCVRSEMDCVKAHGICYHISGIIDLVSSFKKPLKELKNELTILGIDIEEELPEEQIDKFNKLIEFLKDF